MSKEYTPLVIAKSFTKQYYEIIHKKPQQLYRFYKDESNFFHGDENESTETISGGENIREKVESLNLAGAKVDLTNGSIDAQRSDNNAVFLVVTGKFTMPGKSARPFIQSFFLVCQNGGKSDAQPSYYVRNSVFRLFGEDAPVTPPTPPTAVVTTAVFEEKVDVVEAKKEEPVVEKIPEVTSEEDDSPKVEVPETTHDDVDSATVSSEPDYVNVSVKKEDTLVSSSEETAPKEVKEVVPEPVVVKEKVKPASWACLFAGGAEPVQEVAKPKRVPVKKDVETEKAPPTASKAASAPLTVHLSQLPENVVETDVRPLFEPFGAIKKIDIYAQKGFAFVDFVEASGVKGAMLKKGTDYFTIRGSSFQVEERHTKGAGNKNGNNNNRNNNGRVGGGNSGGNRQNNNKNGDKKGDNKGGNNNNRNKTGNKTGNAKHSAPASGQK